LWKIKTLGKEGTAIHSDNIWSSNEDGRNLSLWYYMSQLKSVNVNPSRNISPQYPLLMDRCRDILFIDKETFKFLCEIGRFGAARL
jgi:hypothetical protein